MIIVVLTPAKLDGVEGPYLVDISKCVANAALAMCSVFFVLSFFVWPL